MSSGGGAAGGGACAARGAVENGPPPENVGSVLSPSSASAAAAAAREEEAAPARAAAPAEPHAFAFGGAPHEVPHEGREALRVERLRDDRVRADALGARLVERLERSREEDDRHEPAAGKLLHLLAQLVPGPARHHGVREDDVGLERPRGASAASSPLPTALQLELAARERQLHHLADGQTVVRQEDAARAWLE